MKVVLDTNILLVSIAKKSPYRIIFDSLLTNKFDLIISNDILSEYTEIIAQKANAMVASMTVWNRMATHFRPSNRHAFLASLLTG